LTNEELKQQIKELQEIIHQNGIQFKDVCKEYDDLKAVIDEIKERTKGTECYQIIKEILKESK